MEEKYYLFDILSSEKAMTVNMATALNESSCDAVYKKYYSMFKSISECSKDLYYIAYNNNWYELEDATKTKLQSAKTKIENEIDNYTKKA